MARRRRLSERDVIRVLMAQGTMVNCYRCGEHVKLSEVDTLEREHLVPLALGSEHCDPEDIGNFAYSHRACHRAQTKKDKGMIAKAERMRKAHEGTKRKPKKKIPSRPFGKRT